MDRIRLFPTLLILVATLTPLSGKARAAAPSPVVAMELLRTECLSCHNAEKKKGGLILATRDAALAGGENGPAVVPGKPDKSPLLAVLAKDADPHMPPKKQLSDTQIGVLREWIAAGAEWDVKALSAKPKPSTRPVVFTKPPARYQPVLALAVSPDGSKLAAGVGNRVRLYDLSKPDRPMLRTLEGSRDSVQSLAWSRDSKTLAAGDYGRALLWSIDEPDEPKVLQGLAGRVTALLFLPEGHTLLAADSPSASAGRLHRYKLPDLKPATTVDIHADGVMALATDAKGTLLATGGGDKVVRLWQLPDLKKIGDLEGHTGRITSLAFSPDGLQLASTSADKDLKVWDVKNRERKSSIGPHPQALSGVAWPKADELLTACEDGSVRPTKPDATSVSRGYPAAGDALLCMTTAEGGKTVFGGGFDGKIYVWSGGKALPPLADAPPAGK